MMCPFCNVDPTQVFIGSSNFIAIYNIAPVLPGHSLVIPRKHYENLFELSKEELAEFMTLGRNVAKLLTKALKTDALLGYPRKEAAGQSVPHLHMHIVPRYVGDLENPGDWYQELEKAEKHIDSIKRKKLSSSEMGKIVTNLQRVALNMSDEFYML